MTVEVKVTRDGVVIRDGANIGYVKKEIRQGLFSTMLGASYSTEGKSYWIPFADDGTKLSDGYDTRKRAVSRIEKHAQPLSVSDVRIEHGWGSDRKFVHAAVSWRGYYFGVSRYAHETEWVVDFLCTPESIMPVFSNGAGTRYTRAQVLKPEFAQAATDAAIAAGVWPIKDEA